MKPLMLKSNGTEFMRQFKEKMYSNGVSDHDDYEG